MLREAVLLEVPIIATNCSGVKEILGDSAYGIVVENDEEAIYDVIKSAIMNPSLRDYYKKKIIERKNFFDYDSTVRVNQEFIDEIAESCK